MHVLSIKAGRGHLIGSPSHIGENAQAFSRCLRSGDVASVQTAAKLGAVLGRVWHLGRFAAINASYLCCFVVLIHDSVGRVEWVGASLRLSLNLGHVCVVITRETARVLSRLVSLLGARPCDIVQFHWVTRWPPRHNVGLGSALVDVVDGHGVSDELGRGGGSHLDLRDLVCGIQGVVTLSLGLEFDDLGLSSCKVISLEICFFLDQTNVKSTRARPINVPVRVGELRLVHLL